MVLSVKQTLQSLLLASAAYYLSISEHLGAEAAMTASDVSRIFNFMTTDVGSQGRNPGGSYKSVTTGMQLPLSFWSSVEYFGEYVCKLSDSPCAVTDVYNTGTYELLPSKATQKGGELQLERLMTITGVNVYDAACFQIAASLGAVNDPSKSAALSTLSSNIDKWLARGVAGEEPNGAPNSWRAPTRWDGLYTYGKTAIKDAINAYFFRAWPRRWLQFDPFAGTKYESYITTVLDGATDPVYQKGKITWADFKPITGENSWGIYLGPVQSLYLREMVLNKKKCVDFNSDAIRIAIDVLQAVQALQTKYGAVLYTAAGSLGNTGDTPVDSTSVSVENNASLYAGLVVLKSMLDLLKTNSCPVDQTRFDYAQTTIASVLEGMESFFATYAWDPVNQVLRTGGYARDTGFVPYDPTDPANPQAVDVITWGVSSMTPQFFENRVAKTPGASFQLWQKIKGLSGFKSPTGKFMGVGYSNLDKNGILSGEWTFGAINFLRNVKAYYQDLKDPQLASYIPQIDADIQSMLDGVESLRTDTYGSAAEMQGQRPDNWNTLLPVPSTQLAYLYASKRYFIPFGWYANPLPSTTSTAWALMIYYNYNPFQLGGSYSYPLKDYGPMPTPTPTNGNPTPTIAPTTTAPTPTTTAGPTPTTVRPTPTTAGPTPTTAGPTPTTAAPPPTPTLPPKCPSYSNFVPTLRLDGAQIGTAASASPSGCCAGCVGACEAFTWSSAGGGTCSFKSSQAGVWTPANVTTAGETSMSAFKTGVVFMGASFWGKSAGSTRTDTPTQCATRCKGSAGCVAFSWAAFSTGNMCYMLSEVTGIVAGNDTPFSGFV